MARRIVLAITLASVLGAPLLVLLLVQQCAGGGAGLGSGQALPASELAGLGGGSVDTRTWADMPTLLVLYRSSCKACEQEIKGLNQIAPSLPRVRIVLLSLDAAAPRAPSAFQVVCDPSGRLIRKLRRLMVPTLYLVNQQGKIVYVRTGLRAPEVELATLTNLLTSEE